MAATSSSSNSVLPKKEPKQEPILPNQELKLEIKQEIKQEPQHVLFFSKDVPNEIRDTKEVKIEPIEDPFELAPYQSFADPKALHELLAKESSSAETKPDAGTFNWKP